MTTPRSRITRYLVGGRHLDRSLVHGVCCIVLAALAFAVAPPPAHAILGEPVSSIAKDRKALAAAHKGTTIKDRYTVYEEVSDATSIREYVNAAGRVFAVAWNGLVHPDLNQLLGTYDAEFKRAQKALPRTHGQRHLQVRGNNVVVESWGHMRDLQGRAYLPGLMPQGVTADEIK